MGMKVNDGTSNAPRIEIQQSWWGMNGIGEDEVEWSVEKKFEKLAEAGFKGILGALPSLQEEGKWRKLLDEYGFSLGVTALPAKRGDLMPVLQQAREFGVQYVNSQVLDAFVIGEEAIRLLSGLMEEAASVQVPYFIETHRGRITQDLLRTVEYVKALPELSLCIDLSHYVVAGEMTQASPKAEEFFDILLRRMSSLHGRISNGEQVQIDIGEGAQHAMVPLFMKWWEKGIRYWLEEAEPGDILPVVVELGPPPYSITMSSYKPHPIEISNRWQQSLVFKQLLEEAWNRASQASRY